MATGQDLVDAAREVLGSNYRVWYAGDSIPMWLDDGMGDPPSWEWIYYNVGIECSDLINYALERCGLPAIGGTGDISDAIVDWAYFDANSPGIPGAVAVTPYEGDALSQQGHVLLYTGEHSTIQALFSDGVTEAYTDYETAGFLELRYYGFLPGVDYVEPTPGRGTVSRVAPPYWVAIDSNGYLVANGDDYAGGWYDTNWNRKDWSWRGPKEK